MPKYVGCLWRRLYRRNCTLPLSFSKSNNNDSHQYLSMQATGLPMASSSIGGPSWRAFGQNYGSMVLPMIMGCVATCFPAFSVFRVNLRIVSIGTLFAFLIVIDMTVPMAVWMRYLMGHSRRCTTEMSVPMFLPLVVLFPYSAGLISGTLICPLICASMFPLMLAVMLYRRDMYS